ncbi:MULTISPECIES: DUF4181 domain-containing protein [Bacillus]|nr:DUF4181 domain-containing protein [Bacillus albus]MBF7155467.1 DUF4181 domain-containing protein [Bacillus albus]PFB85029.1 capsular biosynthesis protein CpsH [Bacillus anthracis]PFM47526.1 capsular biosynthesis protein CpsH [Bacillus cereus]
MFLVVLEKVVRKKLNISKQTDWNSKYVNKAHKWGTRALIISYIIVTMICATLNPIYISNFPILFLITLYCFQSYMEWKYDKESREYVISLGTVPLLIITGIMINLFFYSYWI